MLTAEEFAICCRELVGKSTRFPGFEWTIHECENRGTLVIRRTEACAGMRREFHVCYDEIYKVPLLLFNAWHPDGRLLSLEEVWATVSEAEAIRLKFDPWSVITQQEHPIFRTPWYCLHPCKTESILALLRLSISQERNCVLSWLSVVASVVGLKIPMQMFRE
ncbi:hypothetical protein D918_01803 [Trichuris suis]|nr:hypothetical protein D918_01803 [Trichuris suis]